VNSDDATRGGPASQQQLLKMAEQISACSHELADLARQIAGLRKRLEQVERLCASHGPASDDIARV